MLIKQFEEQVKKTPRHIAVKTGNKTVTYDDLDKYANRIARSIQAVCPGEQAAGRVGLLLEHGLEMIAAILGTLKAGKAYIPLSPDYPLRRLSYMLENSEASLLIANWETEIKANRLARENNIRLLDLDSYNEEVPGPGEEINPAREINGQRLAYILYTSGSTGKPKGVMQNHQNVLYFIRNWTRRFSITDADRMVLLASFCHDGSIPDIYSALLNGATLYPYDVRKQNQDVKISQFLLQEQITIWHSVPSLYNFFANTLTGEENFPDLRYIMLGGEQIRKYEIEMFKKHFPGAILANIYGQTESTLNSIWTVRANDPVSHLLLGSPIDNTRLFVVDEEGNEVDMLETGEILAASPHISPGYWKNQDLTKKSFSRDPEYGAVYWTGDLGRLLPGGNIEFIGRKDSQVKIRGFRVEPGEIETTLLQMEEIKEAVVVAKESKTGNTYLCAFLAAVKELNVSRLRNFLSGELPDYMIPLYFVQLEKMPLTQSGKIDRKALSLKEIEPLKSSSTYVKPGTDMEKTIARTWKEVLDLEDVGIHENIFEVGGNSFDIIKINSELSELLQKNIPIVKLFEYPTIKALADYLNQPQGGNGSGKHNRTAARDGKKREVNVEIAVIGMAGRFPGAKNIDEFWENLKKGIESIFFFSDEELEEVGVEPGLLKNPNYVKSNGVLEDIEFFDADFFNFTPGEAEVMDPQLRIFHECAWEALEHAGYSAPDYHGLIGVYSGNAFNIGWLALALTQSGKYIGEFEKGILNNHFSTYISYKLDLAGPSVTMRTACSTSLVAVHMACQGLLLDECDMALAGGVSISIPKKSGYLYQEGMINSSDGHVRAFAAQSSGTVFGDGVGCVVLKRLEDAADDGDYIYAVIKGSAINNDGIGKVGYTAPGVTGQREVVRAAQQRAGVEPESIAFIETHGTGTKLGDTVEIEALKQLFPDNNKEYCALTSVKSNVGHLNTAAGITGFIKTVLSLEHKLIPPSLHFETPNPEIDFENSPFYVNTKLSEWKNDKYPRRAGVSSFGIGGTNAHVILEEFPEGTGGPTPLTDGQVPCQGKTGGSPPSQSTEYQLILLSAKTESALERMGNNLTNHFKKNPGINLADAAYTTQVGRKAFKYRGFTLCSTIDEAIKLLSPADAGKNSLQIHSSSEETRPVMFMFPGQGSQYVNMGRDLYETEPVFREELDRCFEILKPLLDDDIKKVLYPVRGEASLPPGEPPAADNLYLSTGINRTEIAQPAIFAIEYALAKLLMAWGITPCAMIGHSIGEYVAACLAEVFSLEDALTLVALRGKLMQKMAPGAMMSVSISEEELAPILMSKKNDRLSLASVNGPSNCAVSGPREALDSLAKLLKEMGYHIRPLHTSHAFHSRMMDPMSGEFEEKVKKIPLNKPKKPFLSNVTGQWITDEAAVDPGYWATHLRSTVRFFDGLTVLLEKEVNAVLVEVGPGRVLSTLARQHPGKKNRHTIINLVRHPKENTVDDRFLLNKIGYLWLGGQKINWDEFHRGEKRYRLPLPTYPFERQRFGIEKKPFEVGIGGMNKLSLLKKQDITDWFYLPWWKPSVLPLPQAGDAFDYCVWLIFADDSGLGLQLAEQLKKEQGAREIVIVEAGTGYARKNDHTYTIDPGNDNDYKTLFKELHQRGIFPRQIVHFWTVMQRNREEPGMEWMEKCQELGYYSLIFLTRAITEQDPDREVRVTAVTDNMVGIYEEDLLYPEKATLLAPINIIPKEYRNIKSRALDITLPQAPGTPRKEKFIRQLLQEIKADSPDAVTAYRGNKRFIQTYEPVKLEKPAGIPPRLREKGVYLITGGPGGIGLVQAQYLAGLAKARLILTGSSTFPERDQWEQWLTAHPENDAVSVKIKKLREIEKLGGRVLACQADISHREQMEEMIRRAEKQLGPVNGIIHNALQIDGGVIHSINRQNTENVFAAKIRGTLVLEKIFKNRQLDFFILSSSTASVVMEIGHVAYAAACAFLDAYAQHKAPIDGGTTISINWGTWQEVDGAIELAKEHARVPGLPEAQSKIKNGILPGEGMEAFSRILGLNPSMPRVVVSPQDISERINYSKASAAQGPRELFVNAVSSKKKSFRPGLDIEYVAARDTIEQTLVELWRDFFGSERIGIRDDFFELGGDSLKAIAVTSLIHKELNVKVAIATIFNNPTIEELAEYIKNSGEKTTYSPITPVEEREYYKISSAQKRLYILQQMEPASTAYNISQIVGMEGKLSPGKFKRVFNKLIERHESLRTSFWLLEDETVQKISRDVKFAIEYYRVEVERNSGNNPSAIDDYMHMPEIAGIVTNFIQAFDLTRPPLLRVGLIKLAENYHILMVDMHHLISDGVTQGILTQDFAGLYQGEELNPLRLHYKDFSEWQNKWLKTRELKSQEDYWLNRFKGDIPTLELTTDYRSSSLKGFEGRHIYFTIDKELGLSLKKLAGETGTTLYMLLLAGYYILLFKYSRDEDIVVGVPVSGRNHADLENIIGMFVNMLPMRNRPQGNKTFAMFLEEIKENTLKAFENQDFQFDDLVSKLGLTRNTGENPLSEVVFNMLSIDERKDKKDVDNEKNLKFSPYHFENYQTPFYLLLNARELGDTIKMTFTYSVTLFKKVTIEKMAKHYLDIIKQVVGDSSIKLANIKISHNLLTIKPTTPRYNEEAFNF